MNELIASETKVLVNGNYNVYELRDHLNSLSNTDISVSYNKIRNTYTFTDTVNDETFKLSIFTEKAGKSLGLNDFEEYPLNSSIESIQPINLVSYNKIVMNCFGLDFNGTIENVCNDDGFEISNILFWCSRQDVANMSELKYENEDGGDSFNYTLYNKDISNLRFFITDETYNEIKDLPDCTMILQFTISEEPVDEMLITLNVIQKYLLDMYSMLFLILRYFGIF